MEYIKDEHRVHLIAYHLIWCPKRRKPVLVNEIKKECETLIKQKCDEKGWSIIELSISPDHVHLFVRSYPTNSAAEIVKECKGFTAYNMRKKYEVLKKLPCMWTKSYFSSTVGNVSQDTVRKYIEAQGKE